LTKKQLYKLLLALIVISGSLGIIALLIMFNSAMSRSLNQIEGMWTILIVILIRICILSVMTMYMFHQWFKQEAQFLSDIPCLFGSFFLFLIFGKFVDLVFDLTFFTLEQETVLLLIKIRYIIIILNLIPMIFLGIEMIFYAISLKKEHKKLRNEHYRKQLAAVIIVLLVLIESIAVILSPDFSTISVLLPIIAIPSLIIIVWLFTFAYKNKSLSQINPLVVAIGFGGWTISQITRPLMQKIIGENTTYVVFAEIIDLILFIIIFIGFYLEANYTIKKDEI